MPDATQNYSPTLTDERMFGWHASLFPTGPIGTHRIIVGAWRDNEKDPIQIVSGPMGRERVYFEAPEASLLHAEMTWFLYWFNTNTQTDAVLKSAIAHF